MKGYIREFDSLRAFSVLAVMLQHYFGQFKVLSVAGSAGVTMFFVLSGYLITQILLKEKEFFKIDANRNLGKVGYVLKIFYIRRSLRIFPIYYITLAILALLNIDSAREYLIYHGLYLSNFLYSFRIEMDGLAHFWSLAVEEQFYLVWPILILCLPLRMNKIYFFIFLIVISVAFKFWMISLYSIDNLAWYFLMPGCIESFAFGAIAVLLSTQKFNLKILPVLLLGSFVLFLLLEVILRRNYSFLSNTLCTVFSRTIFSFFSSLVLLSVINDLHKGIIRKVLNSRYLILLGKMSYGVYIYHHFVPDLLKYLQGSLGIDLRGNGVLMFLNFGVTFLIAYLSYKAIERPINNLKQKFAYK